MFDFVDNELAVDNVKSVSTMNVLMIENTLTIFSQILSFWVSACFVT